MNKSTLWLAIGCILVIAGGVGAGLLLTQDSSAPKQPEPAKTTALPLPTDAELQAMLTREQPAIMAAIAKELPQLTSLYSLEREQLYHMGEWYGAVLQYKGDEPLNRDTLRMILEKKEGQWYLRTTPPQILLSRHDFPQAPVEMLNDLNTPAPLAGTDNSPAIIPGE